MVRYFKGLYFLLEQLIVSNYKIRKAKEFEDKLNRTLNNHITKDDINSMNGIEFEFFLEELFKKAGYYVTSTKKTGDQGADLIIDEAW